MQRILLINCYQGGEIGQITNEQITESKYFYFHSEQNISKKVESQNKDSDNNQPKYVVVVLNNNQGSNSITNVYIGNYELIFDGTIIKIFSIKEVNYEDISKIYSIFKFENGPNQSKSIPYYDYFDLSDENFEMLKIAVQDKVYTYQNRNGIYSGYKKKEYGRKVLNSFNKIEKNLSKLAQKNEYAIREIDLINSHPYRTEYQHDWERIIHSKSFRRLEDKAQIYTSSKGDHFRTRLTHTLEVTQIARGIARELRLNEDLVEAIALGHDLGHTPFGHAGERTLNNILEKHYKDGFEKSEIIIGGFKHNFQSIRVASYLEEKYSEFEGLNLTYQTLEGILKHTKIRKCDTKENCKNCEEKCYEIDEFLPKGNKKRLHLEYDFSTSIEGQVVCIADDIAQRAHDVDDGIADGIIDIDKFLLNLKKNDKLKILYKKIKPSIKAVKEENRGYINQSDIKRARIVSDIITFFISKLVKQSRKNMINYQKKYKNQHINLNNLKDNELVINEQVISFDDPTKAVRDELEKITSNKIINSEEVNCFDSKSEYIINKLFDAYYTNPRQLPFSTFIRINREIHRFTNNVVDIRNGSSELVEKEIRIYQGQNIENEEQLLKHKIFIRSIADFIAGMTDDFANSQFKKLYIP